MFKSKKIPRVQMLGERLKRIRHKKRISLSKMESLTKIRSRYIDALEKGEYEKLPGDFYIKGFLRKISRVLRMDEENLIKLYSEETLGKTKKLPLDIMKGISQAKFVITPKMIFASIGILAVFVIAGYLWYQISGFASAPALTLEKPTKESVVIKTDHIKVVGSTDPGANLTINGQATGIDMDGKFSEDIKLKEGVNQIIVKVSNKIGKEITKTISVLAKISPKNSKIAGVKNTSPLFLIIKVSPSSSWISVDADGKNIYKGLMVANTSQEFVAEKEIVVSSGNAGSTKVILNNNDLGFMGEEGKPADNIKYSLETLKLIEKGEYGEKK